jgi:predicted deacylase
MASPITFGGLTVAPGAKAYGYFDAAETPTSTIRIPVAVINGDHPGPVLAITAGVHGTEYPGIEAAQRIYQETQPSQIRGQIVMFPLVNVPGFEAAAPNVNPIDSQNLNRIFPGNPKGTVSLVMAHRILEELAAKVQYHVDLHGGDSTELLNPFAIYRTSDDEQLNRAGETLARLYDTDAIWASNSKVGNSGTLTGEMVRRGIPAIVGEAGYLGTYNEREIQVHLKGVHNIMKHISMLEGKPELLAGDRQRVYSEGWSVDAPQSGIFYPQAKPGDLIEAGQLLGVLKNVQGVIIQELRAPGRGLVRVQFPRRVVYSGSPLFKGWILTA